MEEHIISIATFQITEAPCFIQDDFIKNFGLNSYTIPEFICQAKFSDEYYDNTEDKKTIAHWMLNHCEFCQTKEMLDYYKSLNPEYIELFILIKNWKVYQTEEMIKYYKSLNPCTNNINCLIDHAETFQPGTEYEKLLKKILLNKKG